MSLKLSNNGLSIIFGLLTSTANALPAAPSLDAQFVAGRLTQILSRSTSDQQLIASMPLGAKDEALAQRAFKEAGPFVKPSVFGAAPGVVSITADGHVILVDFAGLGENFVTINSHKVQITSEKNILNYRSEIVEILKAPKSAAWNLALPPAMAEGPAWYNRWGTMLGNFIDSMRPGGAAGIAVMTEPVVSRRLAVDIISAIKHDDGYFQDAANHYGPDRNDAFAPVMFSCENGALQQLGHMTLDAHKKLAIVDGLTRMSSSTYAFKTPMRSPDAQVGNNFLVTKAGGRLKRGQNLLTVMDSDYGRFPEIAQTCCATRGCYEQVQTGIQPVLQHVGKKLSGSSAL